MRALYRWIPPRFQPGEPVCMGIWDKTVRPTQRLGVATVLEVTKARCQSGWMCRVNGRNNREETLDEGWLTKILPTAPRQHSPQAPETASGATGATAGTPHAPEYPATRPGAS